jgi:hypothetical protein
MIRIGLNKANPAMAKILGVSLGLFAAFGVPAVVNA